MSCSGKECKDHVTKEIVGTPHEHGHHHHNHNHHHSHHSGEHQPNTFCLHVGPEGLFGCGNTAVIETLKQGQIVVDLGSGSGRDCIAVSKQVGPTGRVIGVDISSEAIVIAKENCQKEGLTESAVEFREGEIENIPVEDGIADVVLSSFAINHSRDKEQVFRECSRILKSKGLLAFVDAVATAKMSEKIVNGLKEKKTCTAAAVGVEKMKEIITAAGFENVTIDVNEPSRHLMEKLFQVDGMSDYLAVANISATKC